MQHKAATHSEIFCIDKVIKLNQWMLPNYRQAKLHDNYEAPSDPDEKSRTKTYTALVLDTKYMTGKLHQTQFNGFLTVHHSVDLSLSPT
jgi:hypothetical protein